ncbi:hypothetical protein A2111_01370 [Candidatus Daviesbacteria bacterium GWA1_38_6]|nr:MAG: hypothetical protein A2111_01370 [Candidatus Daviesbacteria bacterium GWA1_38_6]
MHRILLMVGGLILIAGALIAILARLNIKPAQDVKSKVEGVFPDQLTDAGKAIGLKEIPKDIPIGREEFLEILEASISAVNKRVDAIPKLSQTTPVTNQTQTATTQTATTTSSSGPKVAYIPVGNTGSGTSSTDFSSVSGHEVTIDTGSYPGYKQMVLEVNFRIFQGNGTGEVRLFNKTDGTGVTNSSLSTTSQDYSTKTSSGFTLAGGSKTYTVQVKSSTGYSVDLQWSRIKVEF